MKTRRSDFTPITSFSSPNIPLGTEKTEIKKGSSSSLFRSFATKLTKQNFTELCLTIMLTLQEIVKEGANKTLQFSDWVFRKLSFAGRDIKEQNSLYHSNLSSNFKIENEDDSTDDLKQLKKGDDSTDNFKHELEETLKKNIKPTDLQNTSAIDNNNSHKPTGLDPMINSGSQANQSTSEPIDPFNNKTQDKEPIVPASDDSALLNVSKKSFGVNYGVETEELLVVRQRILTSNIPKDKTAIVNPLLIEENQTSKNIDQVVEQTEESAKQMHSTVEEPLPNTNANFTDVKLIQNRDLSNVQGEESDSTPEEVDIIEEQKKEPQIRNLRDNPDESSPDKHTPIKIKGSNILGMSSSQTSVFIKAMDDIRRVTRHLDDSDIVDDDLNDESKPNDELKNNDTIILPSDLEDEETKAATPPAPPTPPPVVKSLPKSIKSKEKQDIKEKPADKKTGSFDDVFQNVKNFTANLPRAPSGNVSDWPDE